MLLVTAFVCTSTSLVPRDEGVEPGPPALVAEGIAAEARGDPEKACAAYAAALQAALALSAADRQAMVLGLARSALEMKDGAGALEALMRLPSGGVDAPEAQILSARAKFLEGRLREAEQDFVRLARQGDSAEADYFLGVILFDRGNRLEALARFESALKLDPGNYYTQIYRARSLLELDRAREAMPYLEELATSHRTPEAFYLLGKSLLRLGRPADAAATLEKALVVHPSYAEALFSLGAAQRQAGEAGASRQTLERFATVHRSEADRLRRLDSMSQAALRSPRDATLAESIARVNLDGGDLDGAERQAWRALKLEPSRIGARLVLARAFVRAGRYSAASLHYQRILQFDQDHPEARQELAELVEKHAKPRRE